jgi:predicted glycoside hydrolase/deacetylase ChbG (UPF0249 family)
MTAWLIVNADDLGVSKGATLGIVRSHREGIVTSASLAVTTPFFEHAVKSIADCPELGVGLHFTLTSGKPASRPGDVPLLVDQNGVFRWRFMALLAETTRRRSAALLEQIDLELESQLERARHHGIRPTHIDGERHVHLIPSIFARVVRAAQRHDIPFVRAGRDIAMRWMQPAHLPGLALGGGFAKFFLLSRLSQHNRPLLNDRVSAADHVASYLYTGRTDIIQEAILGHDAVEGVTELMVHPGVPEDSGGIDLGNRELERYLVSEDRRSEMNACISARGRKSDWTLTNYRQLAALRPAR